MDWSETLDRFHFDNQLAFNQKVDPETIGKNDTVKLYRQDFLSLNNQACLRQLRRKDCFVDGFEEAGAKLTVKPQPAVDGDTGQFLDVPQSLRASAFFFAPLRASLPASSRTPSSDCARFRF